MFCGIMNLPPPPTKFTKFINILLQAAGEACEESMAEAVHEAVEENDGGRDIAFAVDGSWQKRGFSLKNGVVTVTSVDTELQSVGKRRFRVMHECQPATTVDRFFARHFPQPIPMARKEKKPIIVAINQRRELGKG
ncbi:uncharacterized protein NPIL_469151 [Nephila pilipes]|uniref:Mutator-like transposase domain-containing protein n=1 Tax=Nephila pilipes TaxID=299642 RepID=A0A8X6UDM4_NEPPI|nr:uncharacterized protein NPIL_469151 [Nephila pilipes]